MQATRARRSEEHTSELQSRVDLVCSLLLEKKKNARVTALMGELIETNRPDLVVIACNTASTLVLPHLRAAYSVPFVGTVPFFFFNDTATTEIYTLSLHDALPISQLRVRFLRRLRAGLPDGHAVGEERSEEHTSELQLRVDLVCRLRLEKKKQRRKRVRGLKKNKESSRKRKRKGRK